VKSHECISLDYNTVIFGLDMPAMRVPHSSGLLKSEKLLIRPWVLLVNKSVLLEIQLYISLSFLFDKWKVNKYINHLGVLDIDI